MIIGMYDPKNATWTMPGGTSPRQPKALFDNPHTRKCAKENPVWGQILIDLHNIRKKKLMAHVSVFIKDGALCSGERIIIKITPLPPAFSIDGIPRVVNKKMVAGSMQFTPTVECLWGVNMANYEAMAMVYGKTNSWSKFLLGELERAGYTKHMLSERYAKEADMLLSG